MDGKQFLIIGDTLGYTELPRDGESVPVENSQVLFIGRAENANAAVRQCREMWNDYDLKGESLTVFEIASVTSDEF